MSAKQNFIFFLLLLFVCSMPTQAADLQEVSLQLKWKHSFQFAGFYIAREKGFYTEQGLQVDIREIQSDTQVVEEVLSGRANYGISDSALVFDKMNGKPVVALAAILQHSPLALMTLKTSGIEHPQQLRGKRVMMFGNKYTASLTAMLSSNGISKQDIEIVPHSFKLQDLIDGKVDAYEIYTTNQPFLMQQRTIAFNLMQPQDYGFDFYGDLLFTSERELVEHSARTRKFYQASLRGWRYAFEHIDETIELILKKYNTQHLSAAHLRYEAETLKRLSGIDSGVFSQISQSKIDAITNIFRVLRLQTEPYQLDHFIYREGQAYLDMAQKSFLQSHSFNIITTDLWAPFNMRDKQGDLSGIAIDYWELIRQKTAISSSFKVVNKWQHVIEAIKNKTADITLSTGMTENRKQFALFSKPYASYPIAFATTNDKPFIASATNLSGKTIAVGKNYSAHLLLQKNHPELNYLLTDSTAEALQRVSNGEAYAAADILPVLAYKIAEQGYSNIKISGATRFNFNVRIMLRNDYPELVAIINEAIDSISESERQAIFNRWVAVKYDQGKDYAWLWQVVTVLVLVLFILYFWNRSLQKEIRRRKQAETKLQQIATTDVLTSIHNRYKLDQLLDQQMLLYKRYQRPFSVFYIDLDDFKHINDHYGHETGDVVLIEFANLIQQHIRKSDYFGRWGGEEFLIILPETELSQAEQMANKLLHIVNQHSFPVVDRVTCSIGIAQIMSGDSIKTLINHADQGLYQAKQQGKNRIMIVPAEDSDKGAG